VTPEWAIVDMRAPALALPDVTMARGTYPVPPPRPYISGQEGVVREASDTLAHLVGSRVVGVFIQPWGSLADNLGPQRGQTIDEWLGREDLDEPTQGGSREMRPLRYSINVTLDGCCDHRAIPADEDLHRHAAENLNQADALLLGRVTYEMMESAWRTPAPTGARPDWMEPFAQTINAAKKYVVSSTLEQVGWNAELVRGDLSQAVRQLKRESGKGVFVGGVKLPLALTELGLIDEYEFVVHPRLAGHGPTLFAGLSKHVDLKLVSRLEFGSGAVAMRYELRR
jgi:dihydrofolate reductase